MRVVEVPMTTGLSINHNQYIQNLFLGAPCLEKRWRIILLEAPKG